MRCNAIQLPRKNQVLVYAMTYLNPINIRDSVSQSPKTTYWIITSISQTTKADKRLPRLVLGREEREELPMKYSFLGERGIKVFKIKLW